MAERLARKLLIVGWDAADWKLINQLIAHGRMPHIKSMIDRGARGELHSLDPMLSPLLWTSIATGKRADAHGVLNFIEPDPSGLGLRLSTSTTRRCKALWNILTQVGLKTNVVGWYASHPAEPINGAIVSNLFFEDMPARKDEPWPLAPGAVHPEELRDTIADLRLHPGEIDPKELLALVPELSRVAQGDRRIGLMLKLLAQCASVHNIATWLLENDSDADCTIVFHEAIDVFGHHFMQYFPPKMAHVPEKDFALFQHVMFGIYQIQDMMLGRMLELAGEDTTVILLSDHGFHSDHLRPPVPPSIDDVHAAMDASWHRPLGVVAMAGPGIAPAREVHGATLLDIAPTALTILGVPIGDDMHGRILVEAFDPVPKFERVFSWDLLEGESGMHPPEKRADPVESEQSIRQLIDLGYMAELPADVAQQLDLVRRETQFNLGIVHMSAGKIVESHKVFEALVAEAPNEPRYAMNLSQCLHHLGRFAEARAVLEKLIEAHPNLPDAKVCLGAAMIAEGKFEDAIAQLQSVAGHESGRAELDCMIGVAYLMLRKVEESRAAYSRAAKLDPHNPRAHVGLANVALLENNYEQAAEHALDAVELQHFMPDGHYTLGVALTWMKDYSRAIQCFNIAVSMRPGYLDAHRYLASIYRHLQDRDNARRHRMIAEDLIARRDQGEATGRMQPVEPPLGPSEWLSAHGDSGAGED